jgi:hypothetical protein
MNNDYKKIISDAGNNLVDLLVNFDKVVYSLIVIAIGLIIILLSIGVLIGKYLL